MTKTIKTALFTLLVLSIVVPTTSMAFAKQNYSAEQIDTALQNVTPFIMIDENKLGKFDISTAKKSGISNENIQIAKKVLKAQNNMIQRVHENPNERMYVDDTDAEDLKEFKKAIQKGKQGNNESKLFGIQYAFVDVCGGSSSNPHSQPSTTYKYGFSTHSTAVSDLTNNEFHKVPVYASFTYGDDYHDPKTLYGCTTDSFRHQSVIQADDSGYKHKEHHSPGEPNPEVFAYTHPVWWWSFYVIEWHINN